MYKNSSRRIYDYSFVFLIIFFVQFKSIFSAFSLGFLSEFFIVFAVFVGLINFLSGFKFKKQYIVIFIYVGYLVALFFLSGLMSSQASYLAGILGFLSLAGMIIFWMGFVRRVDCVFIFKVFLLFGCINAVGTFINYYISPTIFGLIHHRVYTDVEVLSLENVTQRGVSFIVSPQSLSLFLSVCFVLVRFVVNDFMLALCCRLMLFSAIVLTSSKAPFVFLIIFYMVMYFNRPFVWIGISFFIFGLVLIFAEKLERILYIVDFFKDVSTYSAFPIWEAALGLSDGVLNDILGLGLGIISRGAQDINNYVLGFGSTESFVLQLIVEIGYFGFFLFMLVYFWALVLIVNRDRAVFSILVALLVVSLFTPTLYGFTSAIYFYFFIVLAIFGSAIGMPKEGLQKSVQ